MSERPQDSQTPDSKTSDTKTLSRRECMAWLGRAVAVALAADICPHNADAGEKGAVKLTDLLSLPNESAKAFDKQNVILTRSAAGVGALSIYCTHRHNKLEVEEGAITCPVHGSNFDLDGKPQNGPASRPLQCYFTRVDDDGGVFVDTGKSVKTGQLAALPAWAQPAKK
jgi:3-phenylpropionate/trans-cinnamate dioxygenase ferredoxin component